VCKECTGDRPPPSKKSTKEKRVTADIALQEAMVGVAANRNSDRQGEAEVDANGVLRVGGARRKATMPIFREEEEEKNKVIEGR
jgi:hypothetical protein